ncbi:hypothetical protein CAP36_13520 [Chitinophagaceae bacterium IBVUCB2]|nr:hypothetical protein CAP36_13520 [Chitinophagaceae bacterium IBVUCB2]
MATDPFTKLKLLLSNRPVTFFIVLGAITGRISQLLFFSYLGGDRSHQALATQNFVYGKGISIAQVLPNNLSEIIYEPLIKWPPGYSFLLTPFYKLFNHNYIVAGLALDILFAAILIFVTRAILKNLGTPIYLTNLFTLMTGFVIYSFYKQPYADAIAITLYLTALLFTLRLIKNPATWKFDTLAIVLSLIFCAFAKYLYIPVVFVIPFFLLIKGSYDKQRIIKIASLIVLLAVTASISALLIYQKSVSGTAAYITEPTRGFYPENLLHSYPYLPAAFINPETIGLFFRLPYQQGSWINSLLQVIHLLGFLILSFFSLKFFIRKGIKNISHTNSFYYLIFLSLFAVVAVLSLLSLRVAKELNIWTYVQEARYYGLAIILLQLATFVYFNTRFNHPSKIAKFVAAALFLLLVPDMARGILFSAKRVMKFNSEEYTWKIEYKTQELAEKVVQEQKKKYNVSKVVLTGSSDYMNNRVALNSHLPMMYKTELINNLGSFNTKEPVLLFVLLRSDVLSNFQPFLSNPNKEVAGYINGFYFYTVYVAPR